MDESNKAELIAGLEKTRARMARNLTALRHDMDVGSHLKESFHQNKAAYIGGATFFGLLLSKLPVRKKKVFVDRKSGGAVKEAEKAGIWIIVLQFIFNTLRPALTSLLAKQVTAFVRARGRGDE